MNAVLPPINSLVHAHLDSSQCITVSQSEALRTNNRCNTISVVNCNEKSMIDLSAYLHRIQYDRPLRTDLETLRALHRAHLMAIPYENFDVQLKRPLTTDPHAAFEKIVARERGGWCYEMNGAFGLVLQTIGFNVTRLAADGSRPHAHLVLTVSLDGTTYVCDVGFADGPIEPYPLVEGPFTQDGFEFRVEMENANHWRLHNHRFGITPGFYAGPPDETGMATTCQWLQTSPESQFVRHTTVFRRMRDHYLSLIGLTLRKITSTSVTRTEIKSADEYVATLKTNFALNLPEVATLWPAICERHEIYLREAAARRATMAR
jgi:N-hydroxyarylamine O-acetyltransferase